MTLSSLRALLVSIVMSIAFVLALFVSTSAVYGQNMDPQDIIKKMTGKDKELAKKMGAQFEDDKDKIETVDESRKDAEELEEGGAPIIGRLAPVMKQYSALEIAYQDRAGQGDLREELAEAVSEARKAFFVGRSAGNEDLIDRLNHDLLQHYGHDMFENMSVVSGMQLGRIPDNYIVGVGDEFSVNLIGASSDSFLVKVDREGKLLVPGLPPIQVAGQTFGFVNEVLQEKVKSSLVGTELYLSMGGLRRYTVQLFGEVNRPGTIIVDSSSDLLTAIARAGGIRRSGSLRQVKVISGGETRTVDFYNLIYGGDIDLSLVDGARIIVPPIGPTVAISGEVLHPGIYELSSGTEKIDLKDLIKISGSLLRKNGNLYIRNYVSEEGRTKLGLIDDIDTTIDVNDVVTVYYDSWKPERGVRAVGNVRSPQSFILADRPTISALIKDGEMLGDEFYPYFAVLKTKDEPNGRFYFKPINLKTILASAEDVALRDEDEFIVFSRDHINFLSSPEVKAALYGGGEGCSSLGELRSGGITGRFDHIRSLVGPESVIATEEMECPGVFEMIDGLLPFVLEHTLAVQGAIRTSGLYPVTGKVSLRDLVAYAGGLSRNVDLEYVEESTIEDDGDLTIGRQNFDFTQESFSAVTVKAGSRYTFFARDEMLEVGTVLMQGEVRRPGQYSIRRGETLYDLIKRAGGLTDEAYPLGAVFTRERLREQETRNLRRAANDIKDALLFASLKHRDLNMSDEVVQLALTTVEEADVVGRMVVVTDPDVLEVRPETDTLLEGGDILFIPRTPNYVNLAGDVLNATSLHYDPNKTIHDYLNEAGGPTATADEDRIYIVRPNGEAQRVKKSFWSKSDIVITPGTTIFVPKDMTPFNGMILVKDLSTILSQLALSAASIAVINR